MVPVGVVAGKVAVNWPLKTPVPLKQWIAPLRVSVIGLAVFVEWT